MEYTERNLCQICLADKAHHYLCHYFSSAWSEDESLDSELQVKQH